jgi:malate dehydrogenase (quinone)
MKRKIAAVLKILIALLSVPLNACTQKQTPSPRLQVDAVLIGGGVMSATLGTLLREFEPNLSMVIYERLGQVAEESSGALNNAGTGHAGYCELNYTPETKDGSIETKKAIAINKSFELSKQFWNYLVRQKRISDPKAFINPVPHMSFVTGADHVKYLRKRYQALQKFPRFQEMKFSEDPVQIEKWAPLVMEGRDRAQPVAATWTPSGMDVNFGNLTRQLFSYLTSTPNTQLLLQHEVQEIQKNEDSTWTVIVKNLANQSFTSVKAKFVFIGAGGGALPLLEKSGIPEAKGYGGFPVGGQWLVATDPKIVDRHHAKVYGKASVGSPPMSVPHLDARQINDKKLLLFGPFAIFSTKYLKEGSWMDLPAAMNTGNIFPMIQAGLKNIPLTQYLVHQLMMSSEQRLATLREYLPTAKMEDWKLHVAGQRVQVIKDDPKEGGILEFGTEVVASKDGSIIALLGASPGASTATKTMLEVITKAYPEEIRSSKWREKIRMIAPSLDEEGAIVQPLER